MCEIEVTRVLFIQGDAGTAELLKRDLERSHFLVEFAGNEDEGLSLLAAGRYAVLLLDYDLPFLNGVEVLRRVAQSEQAAPVIMLTRCGNEKAVVQALRLGAADYLIKDAGMRYLELLPMQIERVLQRQWLLRERKRMLDEARESDERCQKLVELSPQGISVHCGGRFEFINPAGAEILGATSCAELLGRQVLDFVHPDYHQVFSERLSLLEAQRIEIPWMEEKFLRCDGGEVQVEVTALPFVLNGRPAFQTVFRDITERKASELRLERMANYDVLTALPSQGFFNDRLSQLILHAKRDAARFALLCIDLDRFKEANDRLGNYFGDLLLKEVALRLTSCLRESDTVARMGSDQFVVVVSKISCRADAAGTAERVSEAIRRPYLLQDRECSLGANIGISLFPEDGETKELQLTKADAAMCRSKKLGRGSYQFYSPDPAGGQGNTRLTRSAPPGAPGLPGERGLALVS